MQQNYGHPKIHSDLIELYRRFFAVHRNMSKYLRIALLEREILEAISNAMRLTIEINITRPEGGEEMSEMKRKIKILRALIENIKVFTTLLWQLKALSEGFFIDAMATIEGISKQIIGWERFLTQKHMPKI